MQLPEDGCETGDRVGFWSYSSVFLKGYLLKALSPVKDSGFWARLLEVRGPGLAEDVRPASNACSVLPVCFRLQLTAGSAPGLSLTTLVLLSLRPGGPFFPESSPMIGHLNSSLLPSNAGDLI